MSPARGSADRFAEHLRARSDAALAALLAARPDLATPIPADLSVLANRAQSRLSVARALDGLDLFTLEVLDLVRAQPSPAAAARVVDCALAAGATTSAVGAALDRLTSLGVLWGQPDSLHVVSAVEEVATPYPAGLGHPVDVLAAALPDATIGPVLGVLGLPAARQPEAASLLAAALSDQIRVGALVGSAPPEARSVLARLAGGPPIGEVRDARRPTVPGSGTAPVRWLLAHGLLIAIDTDVVELPREVALVLRGDRPYGELHPRPPAPIAPVIAGCDEAGAGQAAEAVRQVAALLDAIAADPPAVLKAGGLGVRELRRLARTAGLAERTAALLLEIAAAAGLLDETRDIDPVWLPTGRFDEWRAAPVPERWSRLVRAWRDLTRMPAVVGERDERGRLVSALSPEVSRAFAPHGRHRVLTALASLPAGAAPAADGVGELVAWAAPRLGGRGRVAVTGQVLEEAAALGITGRGALTGHGRVLLDGGDPAGVLAGLLPEPVDHVLVQADLTVVAPGPLQPALETELGLVADVESSGGATVYRVTPGSVRRALDAGRSAGGLHAFFAARSRTPVPQALRYLIDDLARRHGGLRTGPATSYLRSDDTATLAEIEADRRCGPARLHRIAPTVLVSPTPIPRLLEILRAAGFAPMAEDASGAVILGVPEARRVAGPSRLAPIRPVAGAPVLDGELLADAVAALRAGDIAARQARRAPVTVTPGIPGLTTASTLAVLQRAARQRARVWLGYVDAHGGTAARVVRPVSLGAGYLRAEDDRTETLHTFALHRITSAAFIDESAASD
jgi:hypothetical protein